MSNLLLGQALCSLADSPNGAGGNVYNVSSSCLGSIDDGVVVGGDISNDLSSDIGSNVVVDTGGKGFYRGLAMDW